MRGFLTPDTPGGSSVRRVLVIPTEFVASVTGALGILAEAENWEAFGTMTPDEAAEAMTDMVDMYFTEKEAGGMAQLTGIVPVVAAMSSSSAHSIHLNTNYLTNSFWDFDTVADGNHLDWNVALPEGKLVDVYARIAKRGVMGILEMKLDGAVMATVDMYSNAADRLALATVSGYTIPTGDVHTLTLAINGKNPLSSNYGLELMELAIRVREP